MATEYLLALATDLSPFAAIGTFGSSDVECEDTPSGIRCTATATHLLMTAWTPSKAMRDTALRTFAILATVLISLRIDSEEPEEGHRSLLVAVGQAAAGIPCDLVLYRDEDVLVSRAKGVCSVSRKLLWYATDEAALGLQEYQLID